MASPPTGSTPNREYRIQPVDEALRAEVLAFLQSAMGGELLPREQYSSTDRLRFGERVVNLSFWEDHVGIWMDRGVDSSFVEEVGERLDAELASGRFDAYFVTRGE